jgi:hypothetical protein
MGATAIIRLPEPHDSQRLITDWDMDHPEARVGIFPCGTKVGKSFGGSLWQVRQNLANAGQYGLWSAPSLYKARIGYRYQKAMLPDIPEIDCKDGRMEIWYGNASFTKFMHGRDAEVAVEGDAIDNFVIDEAGKQKAQLWYSLLTTITQTQGIGIITGTPRGTGHWYHDVFNKARLGDPFFCWGQLRTIDSPYVMPEAVEQARRLLPRALFEQYYLAMFTSQSSVYGDLSEIWDRSLEVKRPSFWMHPDESARNRSVCVGVDLAKRRDFTVFFAVNDIGQTVGYCRFRHRGYQEQIELLGRFSQYFKGEDNHLRYDRTGVGDAVGEIISRVFDRVAGDWRVTPVVFTNAGKQEMVARMQHAVETGWFSCPYIPRVEHEFVNLEVTVTKSGLHAYAAPDGDTDDVHWAAALGVTGAHVGLAGAETLDMIEAALSGKLLTSDEDEDDATDDGLPPGELEEIMTGGDDEDGAFAFDEEMN